MTETQARATIALPAPERADDALAYFFLHRLAMLIARQDMAADERTRTALAQAAFSTYLDCADLGLEVDAARIMARDPLALLYIHRGNEA